MIRLAVVGATGRMGRCVLEFASRDQRFHIEAALTGPQDPLRGKALRVGNTDIPIVEKLENVCDVLVDFSLPAGTITYLDVCQRRRIPMVIGVTGHDEAQIALIREAARNIPIVMAANFSVGVNAVLGLLRPLVRALGIEYDIEIVETHHRHKADAPSGTALAIVNGITSGISTAARRNGESADIVYGRSGKTGDRPAGQIGIHAVRMGEVVGQHEIHFSGCGETVTIRHTAHSRETFAAGALRAAAWIASREAGLYSMRDVLGPL